jgi:hypothetical protein
MWRPAVAILAGVLALVGPSTAQARFNLATVAGVYKHHFDNGTIDGQEYVSEDIFELVPLDKTSAYFRLHLEFFNGHLCALWGIARMEDDALVYRRAPEFQGSEPCELRFTSDGRQLLLTDVGGGCRDMSCGSRGGYNQTFPFSDRRPIRYLPRLKRSREFREALAEAKMAGKP